MNGMQTGRILLQTTVWRGLYYFTALIINILIARHFEAAVSGTVYYVSSIYALILLVAGLSLESGIIYFVAKAEIPAVRLFSFSVAWSFLIGIFIFFIVYFFFPAAYEQMPRQLLIVSSVCFIFGNLLSSYCSAFFYAHNNFVVPNAINVFFTLLLILFLPFNGKSLIPFINNGNYFYIYFISFLVQGICVAIMAGFRYFKKNKWQFLSFPEFKLLFSYCVLAFAGNVFYFLLYRVDYFFVEKYCTADQLGNYIQVSKLAHLFFILPTILASAIFPITAGGRKESINQALTLVARCLFFIYLLACIFLALTGKWLFPAVFGASFENMYTPFLLLIPGILSLSGSFTLAAYFAGKNQVKINVKGSVFALIIILAGDILFIPKFGLNAAALVSSIGYIVCQMYIISVFKKEHKTPLSHFFIFKVSDLKNVKKHMYGLLKNKLTE